MKCVLLAGGRGKRLRPLTYKVPKVLLKIKGKPILEHVILRLKKYGIKDFIITLEYMGDKVERYFKDGSRLGVNIEYAYEKKPLGTAGCLIPLKDKLKDTFLLVGGDNLNELDFKKFIQFHKRRKALATVALFEFSHKVPWGIYNIDRKGKIIKFTEKPTFTHDAGTMIFCLDPKIFNHIPKGFSNITDHVFPKLLKKKKKVYGYPFRGFWEDIGILDDYVRVKKKMEN